ncbi:MAG: DNA double-strand break repair nuclease NurA [Candidatus Aquicultor sp.]|nr:DNA double-strand break repair nuclease NurA [Candidatus Aquicultor sp.]
MLDLNKVFEQINALGSYQRGRAREIAAALGVADEQISQISQDIEAFARKIDNATTSWLVAMPTGEHPFSVFSPVAVPESYTVLSTDGSQICPDRHAPHHSLLINIGRVSIGYGDFHGYAFESEPSLFFDECDIVRRFGGEEREVSGGVLGALRQKMEAEALSNMIERCAKKPAVALVDGTLILWNLETNPDRLNKLKEGDLKKESFVSFMKLIGDAKGGGVPLAGYISSPGSSDVVNALRVSLCAAEPVDCDKCPHAGAGFEGPPPCAKINGVTDSTLFRRLLKPGERSALFESRSQILKAYNGETVLFFYLNAGAEIARVELPLWVGRDKKMVELLHGVCLDQAEKGAGYPVAIAEAHEQAVVKAADKNMFDQLVSRAMIKAGAPVIESRKVLRKRGGFI